MSTKLKTEREIFDEALELGTREERSAFLRGACGSDEGLRRRVEDLLQAHAGAGDFLKGNDPVPEGTPAAGVGGAAEKGQAERPGDVIGRYKLLQQIGEGGFGVVYMAEQREPVKRRVALKIIKLGMDTRQVIGRFEAERQALAMMDHPNIAKVLDGGATATGRPYFVMELVRGVPLMEFCDEHHLTTAARLELFTQVCSAIQHAHQKGVIHRDIKPSNVMITMHDDRPVPKVIDFGIAKATQQDLTDKTVFTRFHEFIGTPAYMSPEQAQMSALDIDTRSDIYSLGVLLYELLTGRTPFDTQELISGGYDEMRRRIREEEPLKPSTRLKTLDVEARTQVARRRRTDPQRLSSVLRGDLDWVVMKALEKDRTRRYESASTLAQDVQRFLSNEPVSAAAPGVTYRFRKFARRHQAALVSVAGLFLLLLIGAVSSTYFAVRATRAELQSRQQAAIARAVNHFLNEDLFAQADPEIEPDREIKLKTALDRAAQRIGHRFRDQPLVEAEIRSTIGSAYQNLGELSLAEPHVRRAFELRFHELGEDHPETLRPLSELSLIQLGRRDWQDATALGERVLDVARQGLGETHPLTLKFMSRLAWIYYHQDLGTNAAALATLAAGILQRAQPAAVEPEDRARTAYVLGRTRGRYETPEAGEPHVREALQIMRNAFGETHPQTLFAKNFLAGYLYDHRRHLDEAEQLYSEAFELWRRIYGEVHDRPLTVRHNLVLLYTVQHRYAEAAHHAVKILEFRRNYADHHLARLRDLLKRTPPDAVAWPARQPLPAWRAQHAPPLSTWVQPDFPDDSWPTASSIAGNEVWLRRQINLTDLPAETPFFVIRNQGNFEIFLNGVPASRRPAGRIDGFQVLICDPEARARLQPGTNCIAVHGSKLKPGESLAIEFCQAPRTAAHPPR